MTAPIAFDLTPDPKVLIALTRTPLSPLDALCELIDNSIDGFRAGEIQGVKIENPIVAISLPSKAEVRDGVGALQIRDNGPGMTTENAERSIRAGFSGNNPYDSLGLFGMGFNIATGKLGRVTYLHTCRLEEMLATEVTIDLEAIRKNGSFRVPGKRVPKSAGFANGTLLQMTQWWPVGDANFGFVGKLVQYGLPSIRREIGRRYATILRKKRVRISINDSDCEAFEHCVWAKDRFVERRGHGQIPAQVEFDQVIGNQRRCAVCTAVLEPEAKACPACGSERTRTIEERIRGWVGIQRYDSLTDYGIDLIRNGRVIRIGEKAAFFEFEDELKRVTKDYPIDQTFGRIVGEVHLDHIPVDFLKQDFQRSSPEWVRAVGFLRGVSSLQPQMEGAKQNTSPVYKLYQGYRKVRTPGRTDMYMGYYDADEGRPKRVSRAREEELLELFQQRLPGYFDDSEWWKLVEQADQPPPLELRECPTCHAQNPVDAEICQICSHVLRGRPCIKPDCPQVVALSVEICPLCGTRQIPQEELAWTCGICARRNSSADDLCPSCHAPRGTIDPLGEPALQADSVKDEGLSRNGFSMRLPDASATQPIDLEIFRCGRPMIPFGTTDRVVLIKIPSLASFRAFVDPAHPLFKAYRVPVEAVVAQAVAEHVLSLAPRPSGGQVARLYTNAVIAHMVLRALLGKPENPDELLRQDANDLLSAIRERMGLAFDGSYADFAEDMPEQEKKELFESLLAANADVSKYGEMIRDGTFLGFIGASSIVRAINDFPHVVFDGRVWKAPYARLADLPETMAATEQHQTRLRFTQCLADVIGQRERPDADPAIRDRAAASLRFLRSQLA